MTPEQERAEAKKLVNDESWTIEPELLDFLRRALVREEQLIAENEQHRTNYHQAQYVIQKREDTLRDVRSKVAEQDKEIERLRESLLPPVVYSAIRHYYKQGLFEPDEFGDIENIMDLIGKLGSKGGK